MQKLIFFCGALLCLLYTNYAAAIKPFKNVQQKYATLTGKMKDTILSYDHLNPRSLDKLTRRYAHLTEKLDKQSALLLHHLQNKETLLRDKIAKLDSSKEAALFGSSASHYIEPQKGEHTDPASIKHYIPGLDSLRSAMSFLENKGLNLPAGKLEKIHQLSLQLQQLQASFTNADALNDFARKREALLSSQLPQLASGGQLLGINKDVYYYQQQLGQYKNILNNPDKLQQTVMSVVAKVPAFQQYWQQYSQLSQLFPMPANYGTSAALNGLQTSAQVRTVIQQRLGPNFSTGTFTSADASAPGGSATAIPDQYIQQAESQLGQLKDKIAQAGGSNSEIIIPNFKPDNQHGKPFLQHLTYGFNIQTVSGNAYAPCIADLAFTIGYKANDNVRTGIGASYKLGFGKLSCIQFTHEGVGIRSYVDIIARGSIWITGGWEYNYLQSFKSLQELHKNVNVWQKSVLIGLTKKYAIGKKEGNIQILYDFLAGQQKPAPQAIKFRTGINF